jgi:hypothetical protein
MVFVVYQTLCPITYTMGKGRDNVLFIFDPGKDEELIQLLAMSAAENRLWVAHQQPTVASG